MSRDLADETYFVSHGGMIPVKWTAPVAIHYKNTPLPVTSGTTAVCSMKYGVWAGNHLRVLKTLRNVITEGSSTVIKFYDHGCTKLGYKLSSKLSILSRLSG